MPLDWFDRDRDPFDDPTFVPPGWTNPLVAVLGALLLPEVGSIREFYEVPREVIDAVDAAMDSWEPGEYATYPTYWWNEPLLIGATLEKVFGRPIVYDGRVVVPPHGNERIEITTVTAQADAAVRIPRAALEAVADATGNHFASDVCIHVEPNHDIVVHLPRER